jgi:mono/diheme cytochrome c family protein
VKRAAFALVVCLSLTCLSGACEGLLPAPDFERMIDQEKAQPYEADPLDPKTAAMRPPPDGTVLHASRDVRRWRASHRDVETGIGADGEPLSAVPVPVTYALLARGRERFEITCATCHGARGDGQSEVARHMEQRRPPNLLEADVREFSDARIFHIIGSGYGLMPAYDGNLPVDDRWAVVAYLRALQLSQAVSLDALPADVGRRAAEALPQ